MSLRFGVKEEELEPFSLVSFRLKLVWESELSGALSVLDGWSLLEAQESARCAGFLVDFETTCTLEGSLRRELQQRRVLLGRPSSESWKLPKVFGPSTRGGVKKEEEPARGVKPEEEEIKPEVIAADKKKPL